MIVFAFDSCCREFVLILDQKSWYGIVGCQCYFVFWLHFPIIIQWKKNSLPMLRFQIDNLNKNIKHCRGNVIHSINYHSNKGESFLLSHFLNFDFYSEIRNASGPEIVTNYLAPSAKFTRRIELVHRRKTACRETSLDSIENASDCSKKLLCTCKRTTCEPCLDTVHKTEVREYGGWHPASCTDGISIRESSQNRIRAMSKLPHDHRQSIQYQVVLQWRIRWTESTEDCVS
jgi:hypothetical protein